MDLAVLLTDDASDSRKDEVETELENMNLVELGSALGVSMLEIHTQGTSKKIGTISI